MAGRQAPRETVADNDAAYRDVSNGVPAVGISLTLDDIGWHVLNFGESGLGAETEAGLRVLGLTELVEWFAEARAIMGSLRHEINAAEDYDECLTRHGLRDRISQLNGEA